MTAQPQFHPSAQRIFGTPGGSLTDASWLGASSQGAAKVGQAGEVRTSVILDRFAVSDNGVTVFHDLMTPSSKYKANIDHIVVSGTTVYPIDSKVWKPGRYWTMGEKTRRGFERFAPAEKRTMVVISQALDGYFRSLGIEATIAEPLLFVWPSSNRAALRTGFLTVPGARVIPGPKVEKATADLFRNRFMSRRGQSASPDIVNALVPLLCENAEAKKPSRPSYDSPPTTEFDF